MPDIIALDQVLVDSKKLQEQAVEEKDQPSEISAQPKVIAKHVCRLCNVVCHSPIVFDSHLKGQKHAAKLNESKASLLLLGTRELSILLT